MVRVRRISKVTPLHNTPAPNINNFTKQKLNIVHQIKYLILVEAVLGINRIYLFSVSSFKTIIANVYSVFVMCFTIYFMLHSRKGGTSYLVVINTLLVEYTTLVIIVLASVKVKLINYFENLTEFDEELKIQGDINITSSARRNVASMSACVIYCLLECYLEMNIFYEGTMSLGLFSTLIVSLTHDIEQIYFFTLLRYIYLRLFIVKAHTEKIFNTDNKASDNVNKVEALSQNVNLDISSLHKAYELLHKCSCQLNAVMTVPMLLIFFASGISTIMLLMIFVNMLQISPLSNNAKLTILFLVLRCLKHTLLLVVPCYYSSVTNTQANNIRAILHDAINTMILEKSERRKVKTFFNLTRESDFSYALCGVIKLNMSLPLSYMNLCTTYLVIIIQFSKFID